MLSTDADAVLDGTALIASITESQCDPGGLDLNSVYYWKVDEVNEAESLSRWEGDVWSFTAEPFAYAIENIVATSNGTSEPDSGPEKTVDGSGLNADDQHSTLNTDMWAGTTGGAEPVWIQYEFDQVYKLYELQVWNYNVMFELLLGFGGLRGLLTADLERFCALPGLGQRLQVPADRALR